MNGKLIQAKYLAVVLLGVVILLLVSIDAFSKEQIGLGGGDSLSLSASQNIYRQVTKYVSYETTCSREVYSGTQTVCSSGRTERHCRKVPGVGDECWDDTEEVCSEEPSYSTETYSCTQETAVVENVYDHQVRAQIEVVKTLRSKNYDLNDCTFGVELSDTNETYSASCMNAIVKVLVVDRNEAMKGNDKERTIKVEVDFSPIADLDALKYGLSDLSVSKGVASFVAGNLSEAKNFRLNVKLTRNRLLLKDKVILNRELKASEFTVEKIEGGKARVKINLTKLVDFDSKKKHTLKVDLSTVKSVDVKGAINVPALKNSLSDSTVIND